MTRLDFIRGVIALCVWASVASSAAATRLSTELEIRLVTGVGFVPQTIVLENTYTNAVPVCTYNLPATTSPPVIPRIDSITATSFDLSIQSLPNTNPGVTGSVHCVIAEEGTHTLPDGRQFQAIRQTVNSVSGLSTSDPTFLSNTVNITAQIASGFTDRVVLGAVISSNDARATAFHTNNCAGRGNEPFPGGAGGSICVGHHIGQIVDSPAYAAETIGVIIIEAGSGTVNNIFYEVARGPNTINGVGSAGQTFYTVGGDFDIGVATQVGENGGQGGWAVLFGADPLPANRLNLEIEEEIAAGDTSRGHIVEIVDYWVFRDDTNPELTLDKTASMPTFAVAGDVINYTYLVENTGNTAVDSLVVTDDLIAGVSCPVTSLDPTETTSCSASYTITPADVGAGSVTNNAAADGDPFNGVLTPAADSVTITLMAGAADLTVEKTVDVFDPLAEGLFAVPGNDVIYTLTVTNQGTGPVDDGSIFLIDQLPAEVVFFNGDADGPGPLTDRVIFTDMGSGVTLDPLADVSFATGTVAPTSIADCDHVPAIGFDPAVRFICFSPQGEMQAAIPDPEFTLMFRARVR